MARAERVITRRPPGRLLRIRQVHPLCRHILECIRALIGPPWVIRTRTTRFTPKERNITLVRWRIAGTGELLVPHGFHEGVAEVGEDTVVVVTTIETATTIITIAIDHTQGPGLGAEADQDHVAVDRAAAVGEVARAAGADAVVAEAGAAVPAVAAVGQGAVVDPPEGPGHVDPNPSRRSKFRCPSRRRKTWPQR